MIHSLRERSAYHGDTVNLADLRGQLLHRMVVISIIAGGVGMWLSLAYEPVPWLITGLCAAVVALGFSVLRIAPMRPALAEHGFVWCLTACLICAMLFLQTPWLPTLSLLIMLVGAILVPLSELVIGSVILLVALGSTVIGARPYPLSELLILVVMGGGIIRIAVATLYTALAWAWSSQQQADRLLDEAREQRADLSRTLKSLNVSFAILERTQRELVIARRYAEEARRVKEQFAANISHELRTPLNLILGFSEVMYRSPVIYGDIVWPPALRRDVYQIYRNGRHLLGMIDDILDLSRFEMKGFALNPEPTPMYELLHSVVEMVRDLFRARSVQLQIDLSEPLPTLLIDRTRMRQVVLNLLNNALRFAVNGRVRLTAHATATEVVVQVHDTGPGIPAHLLTTIFDEFYQVDVSIRRDHGGAGLGLAICKQFVEGHSGRIWAESQEGQGSVFCFTLPLQSRVVSSRPHERRFFEPPDPLTRPGLLLVDRDPAVATMMQRHFEHHEIIHVLPEEPIDTAITTHHPHAVIHNVAPDGDSTSLPESLPIPRIFCSLPSRAWVADHLGLLACLTKPVTSQELLHQIARLPAIKQVLLVDDDHGFSQLMERVLSTLELDLAIRRAYDGPEALEAMRRALPDLVLLDLMMPGLDGLEVVRRMRADPHLQAVPVILLTATSYPDELVRHHEGRITVQQRGGFTPQQTLGCLHALVDALAVTPEASFEGAETARPHAVAGVRGAQPPG